MKNLILFSTITFGCHTVDTITTSECKGNVLKSDTGYEPQSQVIAELSGADILLHLIDVNSNCCPDPSSSLNIDGYTISVDFDDLKTGADGCRCMCYMDFDITIPEPGSGLWNIEVNYNGSIFDTVEIEIP